MSDDDQIDVEDSDDDDYSNDPREAIMNAWDGEREQPVI
jgi:hypothetical protein